jgi:hypothetical protein
MASPISGLVNFVNSSSIVRPIVNLIVADGFGCREQIKASHRKKRDAFSGSIAIDDERETHAGGS